MIDNTVRLFYSQQRNVDIVDDRFDLAVCKIKLELRDGNSTKNKLLILQALRWVRQS